MKHPVGQPLGYETDTQTMFDETHIHNHYYSHCIKTHTQHASKVCIGLFHGQFLLQSQADKFSGELLDLIP